MIIQLINDELVKLGDNEYSTELSSFKIINNHPHPSEYIANDELYWCIKTKCWKGLNDDNS